MPIKTLGSIIKEIEAAPRKKQADLLIHYSCKQLKKIIGFAMDPGVRWLIPEGEVLYTALKPNSDAEGRLYHDVRMLDYFIDNKEYRGLRQSKREQLFIELLESVDPEDARLLMRVKDKKLTIDKGAVKKAFPLISANW